MRNQAPSPALLKLKADLFTTRRSLYGCPGCLITALRPVRRQEANIKANIKAKRPLPPTPGQRAKRAVVARAKNNPTNSGIVRLIFTQVPPFEPYLARIVMQTRTDGCLILTLVLPDDDRGGQLCVSSHSCNFQGRQRWAQSFNKKGQETCYAFHRQIRNRQRGVRDPRSESHICGP